MCWNKGRLCWKIAMLFYFCHLKKLVRPETFGPYYVLYIFRIGVEQYPPFYRKVFRVFHRNHILIFKQFCVKIYFWKGLNNNRYHKLVKEHNPRKTKHKLVRVKAITDTKFLVQNVKCSKALYRKYLWHFCMGHFISTGKANFHGTGITLWQKKSWII